MSISEQSKLDLSPEEALELLAEHGDALLVDVREDFERSAGHIAESLHIRLGELTARAGELPQGPPIVFYCRVGARSQMAAEAFRGSGYNAFNMAGGLTRWAAEQRPLEPTDGYVAE